MSYYPEKESEMAVSPSVAVLNDNDPHTILDRIDALDNQIEARQVERKKLFDRYDQLMAGIHNHYNTVANRPQLDREEPESDYPRHM